MLMCTRRPDGSPAVDARLPWASFEKSRVAFDETRYKKTSTTKMLAVSFLGKKFSCDAQFEVCNRVYAYYLLPIYPRIWILPREYTNVMTNITYFQFTVKSSSDVFVVEPIKHQLAKSLGCCLKQRINIPISNWWKIVVSADCFKISLYS